MWVNVLASLKQVMTLIDHFRGGPVRNQADGPVEDEAAATTTNQFGREFGHAVKATAFTTEASNVVNRNYKT